MVLIYGSVMAGDYGEIVTALYLASSAHPAEVLEPKMWRLKSRRTKASEGSDVVQLRLPHWPTASDEDAITCAEVKTKSTNGKSTPVDGRPGLAQGPREPLGQDPCVAERPVCGSTPAGGS